MILTLASCGQAPPGQDHPRPTIAVAAMEGKASLVSDRLAELAADSLQDLLVQSDRFIVIDRRNLGRILEEQKKEPMSKVGKLVGADLIAYGAVVEAVLRTEPGRNGPQRFAEVAVQVRVIRVDTGIFLYSSEKRGSAEGPALAGASDSERAAGDEALLNRAVRAAVEKLSGEVVERAP